MSEGTARGLATVALLKVNYDAGVDHLDLYLPFVLDTLRAIKPGSFTVEELRAEVRERHSLEIPVGPLATLINRARKKGFVSRDQGRFLRNDQAEIDIDLLPQRATIEREHAAIARRFIQFANAQNVDIPDEEHALGLILAFLEANEVAILTAPETSRTLPAVDPPSTNESRLVAAFLSEVFRSDPTLADYIQRMLEGLVIQNALLLTDVDFARRRFRDLEVFFDTGFLFRAVGLGPESDVTAAREALFVLRDTNARLSVFQNTIEEMQRVLAAIQRLIGTSEGIKQLRPTPLVRFLLSRRYQPSHLVQVSSLLERNLRQLGLTARALPRRIPQFVLDEADLSRRLMREDQTEVDSRITHDVDVVAGILTLRAGRVAYSLDDARAVFATTTALVVKNVSKWYTAQGEEGVQPAIHQLGLSNVAWLKRPSAATQLKRHELVALCSAALRPTQKMWKRFTDELRDLKATGELTSDQEIAVLTSRLVDSRLSEVLDEEDVEVDTVRDVVERVRESFVEEGGKRAAEVSAAREQELTANISATRAEAQRHEEAGRVSAERAHRSEEEKRQLELTVVQRAASVVHWVTRIVYWGFGFVVAAGIVLGLPGFKLVAPFWAQIIGAAVIVILALLNFVDLHIGLSVAELRRRAERYLARRLEDWLLGRRSS